MARQAKLHFVYNVDGTPASLVVDFFHRLRDPDTYPCRLCSITYGRFIKKPEWARWVASLPVESQFYTRRGFGRYFPDYSREPLPVIFTESEPGRLDVFISAEELTSIEDMRGLQELIAKRLATLRAPSTYLSSLLREA
ncbi:MAG: hypothetical protein JRE70_07900 [Deltaproteobacteria bacterium]|jgi:hypothetical protein|nr:hypothetical protein [Deltaproteobacteria bacterium]